MRPVASLLARAARLRGAARRSPPSPPPAQSILRDAETEALLQDMVDPLVEAAGLPQGAVEVVLINDPSINAFVAGGQRIYVHSRADQRRRHRQRGAGRARARARPHHRRPRHQHLRRRRQGDQDLSCCRCWSASPPRSPARATRRWRAMALGQQAAMGTFLAFSRSQEASADAAGVQYLSKRRHHRQGLDRVLQEAAEPGVPLRLQPGRRGRLRPHPPAVGRPHLAPGGRLPAPTRRGTGRPTPASRRASSGSRPSSTAISPSPAQTLQRLSRVPDRRAGALCPRLCLPQGRAHRRGAGRNRRAARERARRSLFPRAQGPDPARIGQAATRRSRRCAARPS